MDSKSGWRRWLRADILCCRNVLPMDKCVLWLFPNIDASRLLYLFTFHEWSISERKIRCHINPSTWIRPDPFIQVNETNPWRQPARLPGVEHLICGQWNRTKKWTWNGVRMKDCVKKESLKLPPEQTTINVAAQSYCIYKQQKQTYKKP